MLKIACFLTGDNYQLVSKDTPASKKKIVAMGLVMILPVLIWFWSAYMLSYKVLQASFSTAVLAAVVCATIVFIIEKSVIMANGNRWLGFFRILIGLFVAALGSIAVDEVVFKDDINIGMQDLKDEVIIKARTKSEFSFKKSNEYSVLDKNINDARDKYNNAETKTIAEADGTDGTNNKGIGNVTLFKDRKANERKKDLDKLIAEKAKINIVKDSVTNQARLNASAAFNDHALLTRIKALFHLVCNDFSMLISYIIFTGILLFCEFFVIILKYSLGKTNYERKLEMIEEVGQQRMEFLKRKDSPLVDPGNYLPELEPVRNAIKGNPSIYN
jgi:hypothetical protein